LHRLYRRVLFINVLILKAVLYRVFVGRPTWLHSRYNNLMSIGSLVMCIKPMLQWFWCNYMSFQNPDITQ